MASKDGCGTVPHLALGSNFGWLCSYAGRGDPFKFNQKATAGRTMTRLPVPERGLLRATEPFVLVRLQSKTDKTE